MEYRFEIDEALDDETEENLEKLRNILELLPPDERALLTLFYEEEKTIAEIAHILNQSEGNIKVKLYRLRKKLYVLMKTKD